MIESDFSLSSFRSLDTEFEFEFEELLLPDDESSESVSESVDP